MCNVAEIIDEHSLVEEALANFTALLDDFDFATIMEMMGLGRFQFMRRKQMLIELKGLYIALWRLALSRSFPRSADDMLIIFLRRYTRAYGEKLGSAISERTSQYWGMILPHGDGDFHNVAARLVELLGKNQQDDPALTLRLALQIRSAYKLIFERLI